MDIHRLVAMFETSDTLSKIYIPALNPEDGPVDQAVNHGLMDAHHPVILEGKVVMEGKSKDLNVDEVNDAYFGIGSFAH